MMRHFVQKLEDDGFSIGNSSLIRCLCHVVNLAAKDAIKQLDVQMFPWMKSKMILLQGMMTTRVMN